MKVVAAIPYRNTAMPNDGIKIDKKVPILSYRGGSGKQAKYPCRDLKVGESFLFPKGTTTSTCYSTGYYWSKLLGRKFAVHKTDEGYRLWRVD